LAENDAQGEWALPDGWVQAPVSEIYDIIGGGTPPTKVEEYWQGDIPWISSADIHGPRDIRPRRGITKSAIENSATNLVPAGSLIVVTRVGLGKVALADTSICFSQDSQALVGSSDFVLPDYAIYYLSQAVQVFKYRSRGTTIAGVTKKQLADLPFALPPLPEQRRIVAEIETQFTRLEAGVAALERVQANIRRYKAAVLQAACEGRLVPTEAELARVGAHRDAPLPYEPADQLLARILGERRARWEAEDPGKRYQEPAPPDTKSLPELPEGWVWATVEQIADHRLGKMLDKAKNKGTPRPYLRNLNVRWFGFDLTDIQYMRVMDEELDNVSVRAGDLVVCEGGEPGRAAIWDKPGESMVIQKALHRVRPAVGISPWYLAYRLAADASAGVLEEYFTGSTIKHFTGQSLGSYIFPLPPTSEQRRIVAEVERRLSLVGALEASVEAALVRAGRLRQAVLKQAFEGRLVPQDPDDEPASVLLEHIKVERAQQGRKRSDRKAQPKQMELF
jgi:type I restriction enzyme S subunit